MTVRSTNYLLHPRYEIPRVYDAQVEGRVRAGRSRPLAPRRRARRRPGGAQGRAPAARGRDHHLGALTFAEGRKREVRRYAQALGHPVRRLIRVQFGPLQLGTLRVGASRPLTDDELAALNRLRGGNPSPILRGLDR